MSGIVSLCSADMHLPCSRACCRFWPSSIDVLPLDLMVIGGGRGGFERTLRHKNHAMRLIAHRLPSQFFFIALSPLFIKLDFYRGKNSSCNLFVIARTMDRSSQLLSAALWLLLVLPTTMLSKTAINCQLSKIKCSLLLLATIISSLFFLVNSTVF